MLPTFGLTVHTGDKQDNKPESKTEVMFVPGNGTEKTPTDTADIMLNKQEIFFHLHGSFFSTTDAATESSSPAAFHQKISHHKSAFLRSTNHQKPVFVKLKWTIGRWIEHLLSEYKHLPLSISIGLYLVSKLCLLSLLNQ